MSMHMSSCNGMSSSSPFFPGGPNFILQMQSSHEHLNIPPPGLIINHHHPLRMQDHLLPTTMVVAEAAEGEEELSDDCSLQPGEKKRRLNMEQVRTLEKNFELGNKLEPERKMQLARALGLQPRQIAIWFQNRRARWKTKQLEKDYDSLKRQFDAIKADNDVLHNHNNKLQAQILALKGGREAPELINLNKETEGSCSNRSENSSEINLDISRTSTTAAASAAAAASVGASESHLINHHPIPFFSVIRPPVITQLLPSSSRPHDHLQCTKIEHGADENFSNLLCGMDDQNAFWAWPDHHNLH